MRTLKEIEDAYGCRIKLIGGSINGRKVTKDDVRIMNSHDFEIIYSEKDEISIRCKACFSEADCSTIAKKTWKLYVFFNNKNESVVYGTCEQILMRRACE